MATINEILQHISENLNTDPHFEPVFRNSDLDDGMLLVTVDGEYVRITAEKF